MPHRVRSQCKELPLMADRGLADRGLADRGLADRSLADRSLADRGLAGSVVQIGHGAKRRELPSADGRAVFNRTKK